MFGLKGKAWTWTALVIFFSIFNKQIGWTVFTAF